MKDIFDLLKPDKNNLLYIDSHDVELENCSFPGINRDYQYRRRFYRIKGIEDYLIKDSTKEPILFNSFQNKLLLKRLVNKQKDLENIGFPIGYYLADNKMKGTIIPYYKDSMSIQKLVYFNTLDKLMNYYHHEKDEIDNLINLLIRILELVSYMYDKEVIYTDIHTGNFIIINNDIKVIDFDPGYVFFHDRNDKKLELILKNYAILLETICHKYGFKDILFNPENDFLETEYKVLSLKKELRR